jgi:hypothetical protein
MVGLMTNESGSRGHAVMLNELKTYTNGGYEVFFSETSPG